LDAGDESNQLCHELGVALLEPAQELLREAELWIVEPPEAAPLSVLFAPWSGRRVLEEATVVYRSGAEGSRREFPRGSGALIVSPFVQGNDSLVDMPDTLQWEWMAAERTVELVPRNDAHVDGVSAILEERGRYAVCWLRAEQEQFGRLEPAIRGIAPLILWTQPIVAVDPELTLARAGGYEATTQTLIADIYRRSEARSARGLAKLLAGLAEGLRASEALREARLELAREGTTRDWAGWICLGAGDTTIELRRPSWFQRWLRRAPVSARKN
jgi:hypothetical protein